MLNKICIAIIAMSICSTEAISQDISSLKPEECSNISVNAGTSPIADAVWCGGPGATRTIRQNVYDHRGVERNPGCWKYVSTYGHIHQNEIYRIAISDAKKGNFVEAVEKIAACQCHNPPMETLTRQRGREIACFLRSQ